MLHNICKINAQINSTENLTGKLNNGEREVVTTDYEKLNNIPKINTVELKGDKTAKELKLQEEMRALTNLEIEEILKL